MRSQDKRRQILNAAIRIFARRGYYNSRVADIAKGAGVAAGTVYLYFKNKDDILVSLFHEKMAEFVDAVQKAVSEEPDTIARIKRLIRMHFEAFESHPDLAEVIQVELRQGHKFFRGAPAQEIGSYFSLIGALLAEGVDRGIFRRDLPIKLAVKMLFGAMDQITTSWVLGKRGYRLVHAADPVADFFLNGIVTTRRLHELSGNSGGAGRPARGDHAQPAPGKRH